MACASVRVRSARRVSQVLWSTPPPGSQARVKPKAQAGRRSRPRYLRRNLRTQELESCAPVADTFGLSFLGEGQGEVRPLSRHHVGNRACVAARPGRKTPQLTPSLVTGISWGCLQVVDGNAGTVSSFPARTTVARHDRFCLQVLAWRVRPCGFDLARRVSQVLWSPPPGSQARVKPKAQAGQQLGLDLSKGTLENTGTRIVLQLRIPSAFPSSGRGRGRVRPLSRHHVGNRACVAAGPGKDTPANPLTCCRGLAGGVSGR